MSEERKQYQQMILALFEFASVRELAGLYTFTKAYLGLEGKEAAK